MTFQPGDPLFQDIPLVIIQDNRDEQNETFEVVLSSPVNASISATDNSSTVTITDDDLPPTYLWLMQPIQRAKMVDK